MDFIIYSIIIPAFAVVLVFIVSKIISRRTEKNMNENSFKVRSSMTFVVLCFIATLFFIGLTIFFFLFPDDSTDLTVQLGFLAFAFFGAIFTIYLVKYELRIENDYIIHVPFIGKKRKYLISDITKIKKYENNMVVVFIGKRKIFSVNPIDVGYNIFISRLLKNEKIHFEE